MRKEYLIRADGNAKIGAGHLMRCLTIAKAMQTMLTEGEKILFLCADEQSGELAGEYGFDVKVLHTDYQDMESELRGIRDLLKERECERTILVDSYYVTDVYLSALKAFGRVILLDDMQKHKFPVDVVINYNAFADMDIYEKLYAGTDTKLLVGSQYVPVREQFLQREYQVADTVKNVLLTTGGGDKDNIAGRILQKISTTNLGETINYHLVTGRFNPHLQKLMQLESADSRVHIYYDVKDMATLMQSCDLAITAGGTTIYELSAIGVPFICFSYAENQERLTEYIGNRKIAGYAGAYHKDEEAALSRMSQLFKEFISQKELRCSCNETEKRLIDGLGAGRIAQVVIP